MLTTTCRKHEKEYVAVCSACVTESQVALKEARRKFRERYRDLNHMMDDGGETDHGVRLKECLLDLLRLYTDIKG